LGGVVSCGLTHGLMTPLDLVKCNAQTNPTVFPGAIAGIKTIYSVSATHQQKQMYSCDAQDPKTPCLTVVRWFSFFFVFFTCRARPLTSASALV